MRSRVHGNICRVCWNVLVIYGWIMEEKVIEKLARWRLHCVSCLLSWHSSGWVCHTCLLAKLNQPWLWEWGLKCPPVHVWFSVVRHGITPFVKSWIRRCIPSGLPQWDWVNFKMQTRTESKIKNQFYYAWLSKFILDDPYTIIWHTERMQIKN